MSFPITAGKLPQTWQLKTAKINFLPVLEARNTKLRYLQGYSSLTTLGRDFLCLSWLLMTAGIL
jgi:hypothetical protein